MTNPIIEPCMNSAFVSALLSRRESVSVKRLTKDELVSIFGTEAALYRERVFAALLAFRAYDKAVEMGVEVDEKRNLAFTAIKRLLAYVGITHVEMNKATGEGDFSFLRSEASKIFNREYDKAEDGNVEKRVYRWEPKEPTKEGFRAVVERWLALRVSGSSVFAEAVKAHRKAEAKEAEAEAKRLSKAEEAKAAAERKEAEAKEAEAKAKAEAEAKKTEAKKTEAEAKTEAKKTEAK